MTEYVASIEKQTLENTYFRQVLFTARARSARRDVLAARRRYR